MGPFIIPIALQLLARRLRASPGDSTLLAESYAQRDRRTASRFFLQGPMWIGWTRPKIVGVIRFLEKIPLIGLAGELINGYLPLADEFFYTAAS
jgi:peroxin-16